MIDEFYTKIEWKTMVNILNDSKCKVQMKYRCYELFVTKYIFLTSTRPPEEAYNFSQNNGEDDSNKRNFRQFARRLDYVIKFDGCWDDYIKIRTMSISFMTTDVEGAKYIDQIVERGKMFTKEIDSKHFDEDGNVYWRRRFPDYMKKYLHNYPKCKKLYEYYKESEDYCNSLNKRKIDDINSDIEMNE
ncbi:3232_t:CDS:2, partial [Scutellospora calospora]